MSKDIELRLVLKATDQGLVGVVREAKTEAAGLDGALDGVGKSGKTSAAGLNQVDQSAGAASKTLGSLKAGAGLLGAALAAVGAGRLVGEFVSVNAESQKLKASLATVTGSMVAGNVAWAELEKFASTTPFSLNQSVEAYVRLQSLGLNPTMEMMRSFGNTASAMGKDMIQFAEAVADASTGEFERLKEFGIKASKEGENVALTFQGTTTRIGNNAEEITRYLENIGNTTFGDAMELQMDTLGGAMSNLGDNVDGLMRALGESGVNEGLAGAISWVSEQFANLTELVEGPTSSAILDEIARIQNALDGNGTLGGGRNKPAAKDRLEARLADLQSQFVALKAQEGDLGAINAQLGDLNIQLMLLEGSTPSGGGRSGAVGQRRLATLRGEIAALEQSKTDKLDAVGAAIDDLVDGSVLFGAAQETAAKSAATLAKEQKEQEKAAKALAKAHETLKDSLFPLEAKQDDIAAKLKTLREMYDANTLSIAEYVAAQAILEEQLNDLVAPHEKTIQQLQQEAAELNKERMAMAAGESTYKAYLRNKAIETELRSKNVQADSDEERRMRAEIAAIYDANVALEKQREQMEGLADQTDIVGKVWETTLERMQGGLADLLYKGELTFDGILDAFHRMAAEMAAQEIMLNITGNGSGGALESIFSGLGKLIGGGSHPADAAMIPESMLKRGGWMANLGSIGQTLALAYAGGQIGKAIGNPLGESLFGKEAESDIGATIGQFFGVAGGLLGSMADVAFGGDGKKRAAVGVSTNTAWAGADTVTGASGLQFSTYTKRGGEDADVAAASLREILVQTDLVLFDFVTDLGRTVTFAGQQLSGSASQFGNAADGFFGASGYNGIDEEQLKGAPDQFVRDWAVKFNAQATEAIDFEAIFAKALPDELLADTLARTRTELAVANQALEAIGKNAYALSVQGILAADGLVQAAGGLESFMSASDFYYQNFYSEQERAANLVEQYTGILGEFNSEFGTAISSKQDLRDFVASLDLTTEAGRNAYAAAMALAPSLVGLEQALQTIDPAAAAAVGALDTVAQSLENLKTTALDAFAELQNAVDAEKSRITDQYAARVNPLQEQRQGITDNLDGLRNNVDVVFAGFERWGEQEKAALETGYQAELTALDAQRTAAQTLASDRLAAIDAERDAITNAHQATMTALRDSLAPVQLRIRDLESVANALDNALGNLRLDSVAFDLSARRQAQSTLTGALGGNLPSMDVLQAALGEVARPSAQFFSTFADYAFDQASTRATVASLLTETEGQLTVEEQTLAGIEQQLDQADALHQQTLGALDDAAKGITSGLSALDLQIEALNEKHLKSLEGIDNQIDLARKQVQAIDGVETNIYTLTDVTAAIATYEQSRVMADQQLALLDGQIAAADAWYKAEIQRLDNALDLANEQLDALHLIDDSVGTVADAMLKVREAIIAIAEAQGLDISSIPGFASGTGPGGFPGGLRIVGERGPELEITGPSHIVSNGDIRSLFDQTPLLRAIEKMDDRNRLAQVAMATSLLDMEKRWKKFDVDGLPPVRSA